MLIDFFYTLRSAKLKVTVPEYLTLLEALKAGVIDDDAGPTVDKFAAAWGVIWTGIKVAIAAVWDRVTG